MNFIVSADTDVGIKKKTNQDSLSVKVVNTPMGRMAFAVLCDGMGGLEKGEVASATAIKAFSSWVTEVLPALSSTPITADSIRLGWQNIVTETNEKIKLYGKRNGINLGTTAVIMLLTQTDYYIMNVGDSRAYEIFTETQQLTNDQTFVAREIALGRMTPQQARVDKRRNILLQCIGASEKVYPDFFTGTLKKDAVYMLCSDGFRHEITPQEIFDRLRPDRMTSRELMSKNTVELIELNKQRRETDNISAALVRTY